MLKNLRGFSNTKLAGVLIAIIIVPFVFWGMGSVFSGGNTNNVAKINNKSISTQDFLQYVNQSRINLEYVKENIENNVIEEILTGLVSNKLLEMEIESLNASLSENILANKIRSDEKFVDDKNSFSRLKYEKFLLENNLTAPIYEIKLKDQELKKNLFDYVSGGLISPFFLKNKIYINENKELEIEYFDLDQVYKINTSKSEIDKFIKENEDNLKEELIDIKYTKITPKTLLDISEFNDDFFKKIDEIENSIFNGSKLNEIQKAYNFKIEVVSNFNNEMDSDEFLKEIYSKRNEDKIQLIDKNDYYLIFEISNLKKKIPNFNDPYFLESLKKNIVLKKKFEFNKNIFEKIDEKKFNEDEFIKISKDKKNIKSVTLESLNDNQVFDSESVNLIYTLPNKSFTLVTGEKDKVYLSRINSIYYSDIDKNADNIKEYSTKSNNDIINDIYTSYDLSLNSKYKVKTFNQTIDRVKNYFR